MADGIKADAFGRFPEVQSGKVPVARGYSMTDVNGEPLQSPKAIMGADAAADRGEPWKARGGENGRRVPPHDSRSGLDKAADALRPVGGKPNGGAVRGLMSTPQATPPANGSANPPRQT